MTLSFAGPGWKMQYGRPSGPGGAAPLGINVFAAYDTSDIYKYNESGQLVSSYSATGTIEDMAISPNGVLSLADRGNAQIVLLDTSLTKTGSFPINSGNCQSVAIGASGNIIVGGRDDGGAIYISKYSNSGSFMWQYPVGGHVRQIDADASGYIYAGCDDFYVYRLTPTGALDWRYNKSSDKMLTVSYDPINDYVFSQRDSYNGWQMYKWNATGTIVSSWATSEKNPIRELCVDASGYILGAIIRNFSLGTPSGGIVKYRSDATINHNLVLNIEPTAGSYSTVSVDTKGYIYGGGNPSGVATVKKWDASGNVIWSVADMPATAADVRSVVSSPRIGPFPSYWGV